jgi:hypothetical protein
MTRITWALLVALTGCNGDDVQPPALLDTGWFETADTGGGADCIHKIVDWVPEDGTQGVYWRDKPVVYTSTDVPHAYQAWLETTDGIRLETEMLWDGLSFKLQWDGQLEASTDYVLGLQDCNETRYSTFRTSPLGAPFTIDPSELSGRTFLLDLLGAEWVEPPQLAGLMQQYFTTPILLGVKFADDTRIDLLGAPGLTDDLGIVSQDKSASTWDFPITDFTTAPYLETTVDRIVLKYADTEIPVEDFLLEATFGPDGTTLGGGVLSGLGDSRNLHELLPTDNGDQNMLCELAAGLGVSCVPCADGQPYCLNLVARNLEGTLLPNLVLVELD